MRASFRSLLLITAIFLRIAFSGQAQITPPGMVHSGLGGWCAVGINKKLPKSGSQLMIYTGIGYAADSAEWRDQSVALWVLNTEYKQRFAKLWSASAALSYRIRTEHLETAPSAFQQELRIYGTVSRDWAVKAWNFSVGFRPELRTFYDRSFHPENSFLEMRYRLKGKAIWSIYGSHRNRLTVSVESLFSDPMDEMNQGVNYDDTRVGLFFGHALKSVPLAIECGYMADVRGERAGVSHYAGIDFVVTIQSSNEKDRSH